MNIISTPLGSVEFTFTSNAHVYVASFNPLKLSPTKEANANFHFTLRNGQWSHLSDSGKSTLYTSVPMSMNDVTAKQKEKILANVIPCVLEYIKANPEVLKKAQYDHVTERVERLEEKIKSLREEAHAYQEEIFTIKQTCPE